MFFCAFAQKEVVMNKIKNNINIKRVALSVFAVALATVVAISAYLPTETAHATTVINSTQQMTAQEMQEAIMTLREMVEMLVLLQTQQAQAQPVAPVIQPVAPIPQAPLVQQVAPQPTHMHNRNAWPTNPAISMDQAISIAQTELARHGLSGTVRSAYIDWERGQWVWDVELRTNSPNRWQREFEVYINIDTGAIIHTEFDD